MLARDNPSSTAASTAKIAPASADSQVLDRALMLSSVEHDRELLAEIIELFLAESTSLLAHIRAGLEEKNAEAVERNAHTLKGAMSNFGARRACDAARELEIRGRESRLENSAALVSSLESEVVLVCKALSDCLREIKDEHPSR